MKDRRNSPSAQFNFLVDLGGIAKGGFSDCSGLDAKAAVADYRAGSGKKAAVQKIAGLRKFTNVTLKRGVVDSQSLNNWLEDIREGNKAALRTVAIRLQDENNKVVQKWKLTGARIIKHVSGPM